MVWKGRGRAKKGIFFSLFPLFFPYITLLQFSLSPLVDNIENLTDERMVQNKNTVDVRDFVRHVEGNGGWGGEERGGV